MKQNILCGFLPALLVSAATARADFYQNGPLGGDGQDVWQLWAAGQINLYHPEFLYEDFTLANDGRINAAIVNVRGPFSALGVDLSAQWIIRESNNGNLGEIVASGQSASPTLMQWTFSAHNYVWDISGQTFPAVNAAFQIDFNQDLALQPGTQYALFYRMQWERNGFFYHILAPDNQTAPAIAISRETNQYQSYPGLETSFALIPAPSAAALAGVVGLLCFGSRRR